MAAIDEIIEQLRAGAGALRELRPHVEAGVPWPLSDEFGTEPEASWGPPETLAHLAEMVPFWQGEIERVLAAPADEAPFGRVASDPVRLALIERDRSVPPGELFDRIDQSIDRLTRRLAGLSAAELGRRGVHPRLGPMTVPEIAARFLSGHLDEHVRQLEASLPA
jgi:DinB family protein